MNRKSRGRKINAPRLLSIPLYFFFLAKCIIRQNRFLKKELLPEIDYFRNINDRSLTPEDLKKITRYYALGVPGILGEGFAVLRGKPLQLNERRSLSFLGGISGLLDDLFDDPTKDAAPVKTWITAPDNVNINHTNSYNSLLLHFYKLGLFHAKNPDQLKLQAIQVYEFQENSLKQQEINNLNILKTITWEKGGASFVFYRLCLNNSLVEAEKKLVYHLGGVMQLANDIFDVWEDFHAGIKTMATVTTNVKILRNIFVSEMEKTYILARETPYAKRDIDTFLNLSKLALSRVFVCLDQFEALQKSTEGKFNIGKYNRKQLICDMQKTSNQFKALRHFLR